VFAHHFSVIAGAGPIVGRPWRWHTLGAGLALDCPGCALFGAVHDMTAMFVSMREDASPWPR
jgi:carbon starvation protein CstA